MSKIYTALALITLVVAFQAGARDRLGLSGTGQAFTLSREFRAPYRDCVRFPTDPPIEAIQQELVQEARLKCGTEMKMVLPFNVDTASCTANKPDAVLAKVTGRFSCLEPLARIVGLGYAIKDGRIGTGLGDVDTLADQDAVGQCGRDVIRVTDYTFNRMDYKYGMVRLTASADYECVRGQ